MNSNKKIFFETILPGFVFNVIALFVLVLDDLYSLKLYKFGIYPREIKGLTGIIASPFIHGSYSHYISNAIPIMVLSSFIYYFYRPIAAKIFLYIFFIANVWTWSFARASYHIGASGLVYGFVSFLFFCGVLRKDRSSIALSLLVVFLYGGLFWGIFPLDLKVSWEGHLLGGIAGIMVAYHYRKFKPPVIEEPKYEWMDEEDHPVPDEEAWWKTENPEPLSNLHKEKEEKPDAEDNKHHGQTSYRYTYVPNKKKEGGQ